MKKQIASLLIAFVCAVAPLVFAGEFNSKVITSGEDALVLSVPAEHFLRIRTFTQEGGSRRGVVAVTANRQTTNVLTASLVGQGSSPNPPAASDAPEFMKRAVIAGPAEVTVAPVSGATLFITYIRQVNPPDPTPMPTPTATATPTATPTPTPTPTATPTPTP